MRDRNSAPSTSCKCEASRCFCRELPRRASASVPPVVVALFPQYLFARFEPGIRLHDVTFTRGVQRPVWGGTSLAAIEDSPR